MSEPGIPENIKQNLKKVAHLLGFTNVGIAKASRSKASERFINSLKQGYHAKMDWLCKTPERRCDPRLVLHEAKSIIMLSFNYYHGDSLNLPEGAGLFARYAWGNDYHDIIESKLKDLNEFLIHYGGEQRLYVDAGPILERPWAQEAGLGWQGKSGLLISQGHGSYQFLASIVTTLPLPPDIPESEHCGFCHRCQSACPTQAIVAPKVVDARRCLSYLTIENKGAIPIEFRKALGNRVYGCDICLESCPWNKHPQYSQEPSLSINQGLLQKPLRTFLSLSEEEFSYLFRKSPIKRIKRQGLIRNICVVLGNIGTNKDIPALTHWAKSENALLSEHAQWALKEIKAREKTVNL